LNNFKNIIGYKGLKLELERIIDILDHPEKYNALGVKPERGILLNGRPGIGKTLFATEFMNALHNRHKEVLRKTKTNGEFIKELNRVFEEADKNAPSVILLDDIDKYANNDIDHIDAEEYVTIQSLIDQYRKSDIFVLATSNSTREIPRSLLRAGRLKSIRMEIPEGKDAIDIISHFIKQKKFISEINTKEIARILTGSSCAEIETTINEAGMYAGYDDRDTISKDDLIRATLRTIHGAPEMIDYEDNNIKESVAVHEAGHVVVAEILEPESVNLVSIKSYEGEIGGFTTFYQDESYWSDMAFMEHRVLARLAGKAATEIIYGKADVGCNDDLNRAFGVVERFVDNYCAFGFECFEKETSSQDLRSRKDTLIASKMNDYYNQAKRILIENKEFLIKVADKLKEKKILSSEDIQEIKKEIYS